MYIFSNIEISHAFEWMAEYTNADRYDVHYVFMNSVIPPLAQRLNEKGFQTHVIKYNGKKDLPVASWNLFRLMKKVKPDIVHTHLFDANIAGLTVAKICGVKKRIYTRHHSTFHHHYHPHGVKYDRYCNSLATHIVAITKNVADVLIKMENVPSKKISIVHHGFDFNNFKTVDAARIQNISDKYNPSKCKPVIGVISRFTEWKGVQYIIPAFKKLLNDYPDAILIFANSGGDYKNEIENLLKDLPANNFKKIGFEQDFIALYKFFDVFVHVPVDAHSEAFGQVYVEALAAQLPCVFTLSGIANDFIKNEANAVVVDYKNENEIYNALVKILNDKNFADRISTQGKKDVAQLFSIERMITQLEKVYEQ